MQNDVKIAGKCTYAPFELATDANCMKGRLQSYFSRIWETSFNMVDMYVPRVFPRNDGGYSIQYEIKLAEDSHSAQRRFLLFGHLLDPNQKLPSYISNNANVVYFDDLRLVIPIFPFDPKLPKLQYFTSPESAIEVLKAAGIKLPDENSIESIEILGYRLERRCVIRYILKAESVTEIGKTLNIVAKVFRPGKVAAISKSYEFLAGNKFGLDERSRTALPRIFYIDANNDAIFMESVEGRSLHDMLDCSDFAAGCVKAGKLLRVLHNVPAMHGNNIVQNNQLSSLKNKIDSATTLFPDSKEYFEKVYNFLLADKPDEVGIADAKSIHGDFYDKQIICENERAVLLDCDNLASGDPAIDYGNFLAHLVLRCYQEPQFSENIFSGRENFTGAYGISDAQFIKRANWWQALALLRLAALYILRPRWRNMAPVLISEAEKILESNN